MCIKNIEMHSSCVRALWEGQEVFLAELVLSRHGACLALVGIGLFKMLQLNEVARWAGSSLADGICS